MKKPTSPPFDPKVEENTLYGDPIVLSAVGPARIGARYFELIEIDPDQDYVVVSSLKAKPRGD